MPSIVVARNVSFQLENGRELFRKISFSLSHELTVLVGPNGIGKTCLAKLIAAIANPTSGEILRQASVQYFPQKEPAPNLSVDEYLSYDYTWSPLRETLLRNVRRSMSCRALSGGQWMRVRLARIEEGAFLVLDEPSNDLDGEGRGALLAFLKIHQTGALLISHDEDYLRLANSVLELSNQGLYEFGGSWESYIQRSKEDRTALAHRLHDAEKKQAQARAEREEAIVRQEKRSRQGARNAARGGSPKIISGGKKRSAQKTTGSVDKDTLAREESSVAGAEAALARLKLDPVMYAELEGKNIPPQKCVAEARAFNLYRDSWLYPEDLTFRWQGNIRLAIKGKNGSGKSSLLKAILGEPISARGLLKTGGLNCLYVDQNGSSLDDSKTIFDAMRSVRSGGETEIRNGLAKFLFFKESIYQEISSLSGGERLRAVLARGFLAEKKPELLILDEPTNNLDRQNIKFLETLTRQFRGALIVVSHSEKFLENCNVVEEFWVG
jgi:ATPase subunit of ABC transporter with duplicated ATPase domains